MRIALDVVCVRKGSQEHSVVFLPGLGDPPSEMAALASKIGGPGSIYILDILRIAETDREPLTVESLARQGLAAVRETGRVDAVVGYSFGGLIALEMVKMAQASGERTPLPVLIDAAPDQAYWPTAAWLSSLWLRTWHYVRLFISLSPRDSVREFTKRARGLSRRLRRRGAVSTWQRNSTPENNAGVASSAAVRMGKAFALYRPSNYANRLVLIESSDPAYATPVSMIWRPLASKLELLRYSGGHLDAIRAEECLESLGFLLNGCFGFASEPPGDCRPATGERLKAS